MVRSQALSQSIAIAATAVTGTFVAFSAPTMAATVGVNWATPTMGELNGVDVNFSAGVQFFSTDLSGSNYAAAPLSSSQQTTSYRVSSDWTATFSSPVSDLLLYPVFWRGTFSGADPVTYAFDQPFTILSGLGAATVSGNTLSVPGSSFHNGVIQFNDPVSSLSVTTNATGTSFQPLTFGVEMNNTPPQPVPEPMTIFGSATALGFGALFNRKNSKKQKNKDNN
ncbi:PEP-CTERM sorting domain-containing protein [Coleofasciculus sp. LEGE 07081]|nr:PEP-CTERM sorting domain-containing protein [Coleofasciculus sp. LEGE 07081]